MQISQSFEVASPLAEVWEAFMKTEQLVACLPGASIDGEITGDVLPLLFKVKLGPIAATFAGTGTVTFNSEDHTGVFSGSAVDRKSNSRVKGAAAFALTDTGSGHTRATIDVDFAITGSLAQFSREGLVRSLADQLTQQFAANLQDALQKESPPGEQTGSGTVQPEAGASLAKKAKPSESLSVTSLLWGALRQWFRSIFRGGVSR